MLDKNLVKIFFVVGVTILLLINPLKTKETNDNKKNVASSPPAIMEKYCETIDKKKCTYFKSVFASKKDKCKFKVLEYIFCDLKERCNELEHIFNNIESCMEVQ
mgnify:CR=1 FL=1|jgi:hypothetical protein